MTANLLGRLAAARYPAARLPHTPMRPLAKVGLVGAGYVGAFALAAAVVAAYVLATSRADRQHESGMVAFGDALLVLAVFGRAGSTGAMRRLSMSRAFDAQVMMAVSGVDP